MRAPRWWPWRNQGHWQIGPDVPEQYIQLSQQTDMYGPYKSKAKFLFIIGISAIVAIDIPGVFFQNPYTHVVEGPALYLGILGAAVVGILGIMGMVSFQWYKDSSTMQFRFGAFTLRVRKNFRPAFQNIVGTIEKIPSNLANDIKEYLDAQNEELRMASHVQDIPTQADPDKPKPVEGQMQPDPSKLPATIPKTEPPPSFKNAPELNVFYIPLPKCPIPGIFHLSRAEDPEKLTHPLGGEWIWEGWTRHASGDTWDLGLVGEWQFLYPGTQRIGIIPITIAAGDHYSFIEAYDKALKPPEINSKVIEWAKNNGSSRVVGLEAVQQMQIYRDALNAGEQTKTSFIEHVTNLVGYVSWVLEMNPNAQTPYKKKSKLPTVLGLTAFTVVASLLTLISFGVIHVH